MLNLVPVRPVYHRRVAGVLAKGRVERGFLKSSPKVSSGALAPEPLGALLLKASSGEGLVVAMDLESELQEALMASSS
jgi:hypothetical protein